MPEPLVGKLPDSSIQKKISKSPQKQESFSVNYASSVFDELDSNTKPNNNIFKTENKKLTASYNAFKKAVFSGKQDPEKIKDAADNFTANSIMEDFKDDEKINQSIFKKGNNFGELSQLTKKITKDDLIKIILKIDKEDDGVINNSPISNNKGLQKYLDMADNQQEDKSVQNYNSYLQEEGYDPIQNYNVFDMLNPRAGLPIMDSLGSSLDPYGVGQIRNAARQVIYNPNEYADVSRENYQYTVKPDSIIENGFASKAAKIALGEIKNTNQDGKYGKNAMWCADFATWALKKANGGVSPFGKDISSVQEFVNEASRKGLYRENNENSRNNLKPGDLITFNTKRKNNGHIGIITKADRDANGNATVIHTSEGNSSGKVSERSYPVNNNTISGFIDVNSMQ